MTSNVKQEIISTVKQEDNKSIISIKEVEEEPFFDSSIFRQYIQEKFTKIISEKLGQKYFIIDPYLQENIMNIILYNDQIKDKILNRVKGQPEDQNEFINLYEYIPLSKNITLIFFIYPDVKAIKKVINICQETRKIRKIEQLFDIYFWPQRNFLSTEIIQLMEAQKYLNVRDFICDLIPLDTDLLSLEINTAFRDLYLDGDLQPCQFSVNAILKLEDMFGKIANVFAIGKLSRYICEIISLQQNNYQNKVQTHDIESLIIFDRSVDFFTPFCSQLLYQGLLEDIFGIKGNLLTLPGSLFKEGDSKNMGDLVKRCTGETKHKNEQNYGDDIFQTIKDKPIAEAKKEIQASHQIIQEFKIQSKKLDKKNAELSEATELVKKSKKFLLQINQISDHIQICSQIEDLMRTIAWYKSLEIEQNIMIKSQQQETIDYCEVLMALCEPIEKVLQLLCLQSIMDNGLSKSALQYIEKDIFLTYGYSNLTLIDNLKAVELLKYKEVDKKDSWSTVMKTLNLVTDVVNPQEISYPYSGYTPILPKLVQEILQNGHLDKVQQQLCQIINSYDIIQPLPLDFIPIDRKIKPVVVFVVGGITYGEIAALRILGKKFNKELLIVTTNIISCRKIISNLEHRKIDPLVLV